MKATEVAKVDSQKSKKVDDDTCERPSELNWVEAKQIQKLKTINKNFDRKTND